ncbi:MAG: F420-0--gamma-glutamyl ligase [Tissierellia bacterium]|nr:F420-0--gamma-glutamyl ligase [Tissierellia bacterium]
MNIMTSNGVYEVYPIKTDLIRLGDSLEHLLSYVEPYLSDDDTVFVSEKVISIIQGRIRYPEEVKVSKLASFLSSKVNQRSDGNLNNPESMEMAIREVGTIRILIAAMVAAITKPLGIKGMFYRIAGKKVRGIDSPDKGGLPPYNEFISLTPESPNTWANKISQIINHKAVIVDANDIGVNILGVSDEDMDRKLCAEIFISNPLGQKREQTPIAIVRKRQ